MKDMSTSPTTRHALLAAFAEGLSDDVEIPADDKAAISKLLQARMEEAVAAWTTVKLDCPERYVTYLARRLRERGRVLDELAELNTTELILACACVDQAPGALTLFETIYFPLVRRTLFKLEVDASVVDEVLQDLRQMLFMPRPKSPPLMTNYAGRGRLDGWLIVIAIRVARKHASKGSPMVPLLDNILETLHAADPQADPDKKFVARRYTPHFKRAFRQVWKALDATDRELLRRRYVKGQKLHQLASLYGVHRTTVARRVTHVQEQVFNQIRASLSAQLSLPPTELDSILTMIQSHLDITLTALSR